MRKDLSWRHATAADLDRVTHIQTLSKWTQREPLSKRAGRVLGFFAALNRLGTFGYRGTRCSQPALARAISRATLEAASIPTIQRALSELRVKGYLTVGTAYGKPRKTFPDVWQREPIRVYSLTEKAVSVWSKKVSYIPTSIKKEPFRSVEQKIKIFMPERAHVNNSTDISLIATNDTRKNKMTSEDLTKEKAAFEHGKEQKTRQGRFRGVPEKSMSSARKCLLSDICSIVAGRGRAGKMIAAKAALCLADPSQKSGVDWTYWLVRWPMMTRGERMTALRSEIVPVMNTWIQPEERISERVYEPEARTPASMEQTFEGLRAAGFDSCLLARIAQRCG